MTKVSIGKTFEFAAAHRLYRPEWSEAKNAEVFGKCAHPQSHGHNYKLEISVLGEPHPETGYVLDAAILNAVVEETVLSKVDHKHLDKDLDWFKDKTSSVENLVNIIWDELEAAFKPHHVALSEIRIWETGRIFATRRI